MRENAIDSKDTDSVQPVWIKVKTATQLTEFSRSKIYELMGENAFRTASFRNPGQRHATRLIDRESLLAFIEAHVETR